MLSTPLPKLAISLSCSPACASTASSIRSVTVGTSTSAVFTASTSSRLGHRLVVDVEPGVEQFAHPRLDDVGQLARDDDQRLLSVFGMFLLTARRRGADAAIPAAVQVSLTALAHTAQSGADRVANPAIFLPDGSDNDKALRTRMRLRRRCALALAAARAGACRSRRPPIAAGELGRRRGQRPAGAALRQPEVRPGQCARRPDQGPRRRAGSSPAPACRSRSPPNSRTGGASATAEGAEGWVYHSLLSGRRTARGRAVEERAIWCRSTRTPDVKAPWSRSCKPACWAR